MNHLTGASPSFASTNDDPELCNYIIVEKGPRVPTLHVSERTNLPSMTRASSDLLLCMNYVADNISHQSSSTLNLLH